jgi:hypothetical protein
MAARFLLSCPNRLTKHALSSVLADLRHILKSSNERVVYGQKALELSVFGWKRKWHDALLH